ncbi:unnamed protein product [Symbiodinium sp. CCMP2592]|nr:unnamed protein product [Symbiodinium sp. CCMP2592]
MRVLLRDVATEWATGGTIIGCFALNDVPVGAAIVFGAEIRMFGIDPAGKGTGFGKVLAQHVETTIWRDHAEAWLVPRDGQARIFWFTMGYLGEAGGTVASVMRKSASSTTVPRPPHRTPTLGWGVFLGADSGSSDGNAKKVFTKLRILCVSARRIVYLDADVLPIQLKNLFDIPSFRGAAFVGGFSYADTLDSAKGWAGSVLFSPKLEAQFKAFRDRADSFALGICNGCQLLALLGWAPGAPGGGVLPLEKQPRFVHNRSGRFESRFATVRIDSSAASKVWLKGMEGTQMGVWVNHGEGQAHFPDASVLDRVKKEQLIPMRYVDDDGKETETYPFNPNGSPEGIVGLCSADGRHLAIMPHPERLTSWPWQWPYAPQEWMAGAGRLKASPWLKMFQNVREWCDGSK